MYWLSPEYILTEDIRIIKKQLVTDFFLQWALITLVLHFAALKRLQEIVFPSAHAYLLYDALTSSSFSMTYFIVVSILS